MADLIFLIHGMGLHDAGWDKPYRKTLVDAYKKYAPLSSMDFDRRFKLVVLEYDRVFQTLLSRWQQDASALDPIAANVGATLVASQLKWLREAANKDNNYFWTHCGDVALYRLFPAVRDAVCVHVAKQIAAEVAQLDGERWNVIGYSLGTAVAHDTLNMLWTKTLPGGLPTGWQPSQAHANVVAMIANVSRVVENDTDVYKSAVKPGPASKMRACNVFLSARHHLDPFTTPRPFDPLAWPDAGAEDRGEFVRVKLEHIHHWNVHAFEHYLEHPALHVPLFRGLAGFAKAIPEPAAQKALEDFPQFGGVKSKAIEFRTWLEGHAPSKSDGWEAFCSIAEWFVAGPTG